ncbi:MAG: tandem-95 repeat protein, partial [Pseudomonadota bacterium]
TDGALTSNAATATVTVAPVNDAPVLQPTSTTIDEDQSANGNLLSTATDAENDVFIVVDFTLDGVTHLAGTTAVLNGVGSLSVASDGQYSFTPVENWSGSLPTVTYTVSDGTGTAQSSLDIDVTPVADAPTLDLDTQTITPPPTGLIVQTWNNLILGSNGNGATPGSLQSAIESAGPAASTQSLDNVTNSSVSAGVASRASGLIHLEAGNVYTFNVSGDDSVRVVVGGVAVTEATWGGNSGAVVSGAFTPTTSGYYTLDVYHHNQNGPGNYDLNFSVSSNGVAGPVLDLSSANVPLFQSTADLLQAGIRLSPLQGEYGNGYYSEYVQNEGDEDTAIPLSSIQAALTDIDGSESLQLSIDDIPVGATLSDGNQSFTAILGQTSADVSLWNLSTLTLTPPTGFTGQFQLQIIATAIEGANSDTAVTSLPLTVVVHEVTPPVGGNQNPVAVNDTLSTNEDVALTIAPSSLLANDSDSDGGAPAIVSVQNAIQGTVAVVNGNVVFTPTAGYNGPASFTYSIADGRGGTSTATVNITVNAVNDAPVNNSPGAQTIAEDSALVFSSA